MTPVDAPSPWHRGELEAQQRAGVDPRHTASVTGFLRPYLDEQHRAFYPRLPFIVVGVVDAAGRPWATLLEGQPGFMVATDDTHLRIAAVAASGDPAASALSTGSAIGLLGIELETRRRNRLNGHVSDASDGGLQVEVDRAYGNCPKYIHTRDLRFHDHATVPVPPERFETLDGEAIHRIAHSGTFFVASASGEPALSVDVSHRGGRPGFVEVDGDWLTIPDFQGNQFFNTLGNFLVNPKAGLLFPDFRSGDVLQLTGSVEVLFDSPRLAAFEGAQRLWRFHVDEMVRRRGVLHWRGDVRDESAEAGLTGTWHEAQARERAATTSGWRPFRVEQVTDEASDVRSFTLKPVADGAATAGEAGMHLVIRMAARHAASGTIASYSLSRMPADGSYRISVKRGGETSRAVWTALEKGAVVELRGPQGEFVTDPESRRPVVLLSAGIGITPMLAMAEQILETDRRAGTCRRVHFLHGARGGAAMPFRAELSALETASNGLLTVTRCFSRPAASDRQSVDFEFEGRLDLQTLRRTLSFDDYDFYLCGPAGFMQQMYDGLRSLNIADERIRAEAFGPASLRRDATSLAKAPVAVREAATEATPVTFGRSHRQATWSPASGTLLELAEQSGLEPEFGCRDGTCGTCRTRVVSGKVAYPGRMPPELGDDAALICCAVPAAMPGGVAAAGLVLDL